MIKVRGARGCGRETKIKENYRLVMTDISVGPILMRSSTHFAQLQKFGAQF